MAHFWYLVIKSFVRNRGPVRAYVRDIMTTSHGNKAEAARRLGITRYALYRTLRRLGIETDDAPVELEAALAS